MTQKIDPVKLKAAAEHLEWVCQQYPNEVKVQGLYKSLQPMIEDAKAGRVMEPVSDAKDVPGNWAVYGEHQFDDYKEPRVVTAFGDFAEQMVGGPTDDDNEIDAIINQMMRDQASGGQHG